MILFYAIHAMIALWSIEKDRENCTAIVDLGKAYISMPREEGLRYCVRKTGMGEKYSIAMICLLFKTPFLYSIYMGYVRGGHKPG